MVEAKIFKEYGYELPGFGNIIAEAAGTRGVKITTLDITRVRDVLSDILDEEHLSDVVCKILGGCVDALDRLEEQGLFLLGEDAEDGNNIAGSFGTDGCAREFRMNALRNHAANPFEVFAGERNPAILAAVKARKARCYAHQLEEAGGK